MQQDTDLLDRLAGETAPEGFDVIIDDCSHIGELTRISFWHLFDNHLKSGGLYVIEDWSTGYWQSFFDGMQYSQANVPRFNRRIFRMRSGLARLQANKTLNRVPLFGTALRLMKRSINQRQFRSHNFGLVGFIKELVDECGMGDITREDYGKPPHRPSKFKEMRIFPGQVFIVKA
jgi:capsule polysaccharide export protein KpsC/LpsZ